MVPGQIRDAFFPLMQNGKAEGILGLVLIVLSLIFDGATVLNVIAQLLIVAIIPLLRFAAPAASFPLVAIAGLWISGNIDHLLLSGFIFYLALEYAIAIKRWVSATVLSIQWLVLAYFISVDTLFSADLLPSLVLEGALIMVAGAVGHARFVSARTHRQQQLAQQKLEHALTTGISCYLHDSVARSLTMMTMQAEIAQMSTSDPELGQQLRTITETGKIAVSDLHQLVNHLIDTNLEDTTDMLGVWHAHSITETITAAVTLLEKSGYNITVENVGLDHRLPRPVEAAFALAFNEATTNLVKHAPRNSPIIISVNSHPAYIDIGIVNKRTITSSYKAKDSATRGIGLTSMTSRMADVGGSADITATPNTWQITLSVPITTKK